MFDEKRLVRDGDMAEYPLCDDGKSIGAFTAWAVYDANPHYKTVDIHAQADSVSLTVGEARELMDALGYFLAMHALAKEKGDKSDG